MFTHTKEPHIPDMPYVYSVEDYSFVTVLAVATYLPQ